MGQEVYINFDVEDLKSARCRGVSDLRVKKFSQFVAGDSTVYDLFLTGTSGLLNIQSYTAIRMGVGNLNQRPESGQYTIAGSQTLAYNHSAANLEAAIEAVTGNGCSVSELTPFVYKVEFDAVGAQTVPAIDSTDLLPASSVTATVLVAGSATTKESWLWRIYRNALAFTDSFTNIAGQGVQTTLSLATPGIYDLLNEQSSVSTFIEVEVTDASGNVQTIAQIPIKVNGEVIGTGFEGTVPSARTINADAVDFLNSFPEPIIKDQLTIQANQTPDDNAKLLMIDKSTPAGRNGALEKKDGQLLIGPDETQQWQFKTEGTTPVFEFPANSGLRFNGGDLLKHYSTGTFTPKLESGDGTVVQTDYDINQSVYVKVGDFVFVNIYIRITNFTADWKTSTKNWRLTNLPYAATGNHNIEVRPLTGWLDLGNDNITGALNSGNNYIWFEKFVDSGTTAGQGFNTVRINSNQFVTHPFNFTSGSFSFTVTGGYNT